MLFIIVILSMNSSVKTLFSFSPVFCVSFRCFYVLIQLSLAACPIRPIH